MKELVNRLHYLMTGTLATAASGTYTACTISGLTSCNVVVGWESLENDFTKIAYTKFPAIVIDLVQGQGEQWANNGQSRDQAYTRSMSLTIDLVVRSTGERQAIIGDAGILNLWEYLDTFLRSDNCVFMVYGGNRYTDAMDFPRSVEDGVGASQDGRIMARARRATLTWSGVVIDA